MSRIADGDNTFPYFNTVAPKLKNSNGLYLTDWDKNREWSFMTIPTDSIFMVNIPIMPVPASGSILRAKDAEAAVEAKAVESKSDKKKTETYKRETTTDDNKTESRTHKDEKIVEEKNVESHSQKKEVTLEEKKIETKIQNKEVLGQKIEPKDLDDIFQHKAPNEYNVDDFLKFKPISQMKKEEKIDEACDLITKNNSKSNAIFFKDLAETDKFSEKAIDSILQAQRKISAAVLDKQDGIIGSFAQGNTGDCWFLAGLKIIASTQDGAKDIKESINDNGNGTYSINFKGAPGKTFTVSEKELKERVEFAFGDKDVRILEIAADKWRKETNKSGLDAGGYYSEVKKLLTGNGTKTISTNGEYSVVELPDGDQQWFKTEELVDKIPEGYFFNSEFPSKKDKNSSAFSGFIPTHAYYAEKRGVNLIVHDPADTSKEPKTVNIIEFLKSGGVLNY